MLKGSRVLTCLRSALLVSALCWAAGSAWAQQKPPAQGQQPPGPGQSTIITDAAGRKHVRNPRITDAQRKAVAKRMTAAKAAARKGKVTP